MWNLWGRKKFMMVQRKQAHDSRIGWCDDLLKVEDLLLEVDTSKKGEPNNSGCSRGGEATCA